MKTIDEEKSETNKTIITNKRIYHFELAAKKAKGINDQDLIFVAIFTIQMRYIAILDIIPIKVS